jgi:NAD-dependent dihydropyrimidine dehydrogenase PreA subunit
MKINKNLCIGCGMCIPYCPMGAIKIEKNKAEINFRECVECGVCYRVGICPVNAIYQQTLEWPRVLRAHFSNPMAKFPETGLAGRGTAEMKTNDVTGRFKSGEVGFSVELGRPGIGAKFRDVEKVTMAIASIDELVWEEENPLIKLMSNKFIGTLKDDILDEKILSAIIEFKIPLSSLTGVMECLKKVSSKVDTVFTISVISRVEEDGKIPNIEKLIELGFKPRPNPKVNIGIGRPLYINNN